MEETKKEVGTKCKDNEERNNYLKYEFDTTTVDTGIRPKLQSIIQALCLTTFSMTGWEFMSASFLRKKGDIFC